MEVGMALIRVLCALIPNIDLAVLLLFVVVLVVLLGMVVVLDILGVQDHAYLNSVRLIGIS